MSSFKYYYYYLIFLLVLTCSVASAQVVYEGPQSLTKARVAVATGTTHDNFMSKNYPDADIVRVDNRQDVFLILESGRVDFSLADLSLAENVVRSKPQIEIIDSKIFADPVAIGFRKGETELHSKFNVFLRELKQSEIYEQMKTRWFENPDPVVPEFKRHKKGKLLKVGINSSSFPLAYVSNGEFAGFEIELIYRFAEKEGYVVEISDINFPGLISSLVSSKVDLIAASICITEEREKQVLFSDPYYECPSVVTVINKSKIRGFVMPTVVPSDLEKGATLDDTIRTVVGDRRVAVVEGTIQEHYVSTLLPSSQVAMAREHPDAFLMVQTNNAAYTLCNIGVAKNYMSKDSTLDVFVNNILSFTCHFGINKKNKALQTELNDFIIKLRNEGKLTEIHNRWFELLDKGKIPELDFSSATDVLRVGSGCTAVPFTFVAEGEYRGIDIEVLSLFAQATGRRIEVVELPFGSLIAALSTGKVDLIANTLSATEERKKVIDFSEPYDVNFSVLMGVKQVDSTAVVSKGSWLNSIKESFVSNLVVEKRYLLVINGLKETVILSIFSLLVGTIIGAVICYLRMRKSVLWSTIARLYVDIMRGIPVLVLLMINFYVIFANTPLNATTVAVLSFAMNFGAYVSEMFRSSISSIDKGQYEAGIAMGFTPIKTFTYIIAPQAITRVAPVYKGEAISLIKMTSIVGYIAVQDLTKVSDIIRSRTFDAFFPLVLVAVIYFLLAWGFSVLLDFSLRKLSVNDIDK